MHFRQIKRRHYLLAFTVTLIFASGSISSEAATIQRLSNRFCAFSVEGAIVSGDLEKLTEIVRQHPPDQYDERTFSVCLKSPGGSYDEGMKIAEFIFSRGLSTVVESGADCFSACAIIFMAGTGPGQAAPLRKLSAMGLLGFHAPYLSVQEGKYSKEELELASQQMTRAILRLVRFASKETALGGDFLKRSMIERILAKGPSEAFFVRTVFDAARWGIILSDADEHYQLNLATIRGATNMCDNFHFSNMDQDINRKDELSMEIDSFASKYHAKDFRVLIRNGRTKDLVCEFYPKEDKRKKVSFTGCSYDYWSSKSFGNCREYRTRPSILIGHHVPQFFALNPSMALKRFK